MKRSFHLCLSAHNEVMFRDEEDYNKGFNTFALALYRTNSTGLVESFMSNHVHFLIQSESPEDFMGAFRMPYAYPHSSANVIFQKDMGKSPTSDLLPRESFYRYIGRRLQCPDSYKMSTSGLFLRESVLDIPQVENMFMTPRTFDYYMSRRTSEDWINEQSKDGNDSPPITLDSIESQTYMSNSKQMLINEGGRLDYKKITDIELCTEIDRIIQNDFGKQSVYLLSPAEKRDISNLMRKLYYPSSEQLDRCLAVDYL